jgi:hypothetical protein
MCFAIQKNGNSSITPGKISADSNVEWATLTS